MPRTLMSSQADGGDVRDPVQKTEVQALQFENANTPKRFLASGCLFIQMVGEIHDRMSRDAVAWNQLVRAGSLAGDWVVKPSRF
jgi:hypothetical protein